MNANELGAMPVHPDAMSPGMTIRQRFAMAAMQATLTRKGVYDHAADAFDCMAYEAVRAADALLTELAKDQP